MATSQEQQRGVPRWDGNPAGWRRYKREVAWYESGVKVSERRYIVGRITPYLSGPARTLVQQWSPEEFDCSTGVQRYFYKLGVSHLVRQALPDAISKMDSFFEFGRNKAETLTGFLVRQEAVYHEFVESLMRLREERDGIKLEPAWQILFPSPSF